MLRRAARLTLQSLEDRTTPAAAGTLDPSFGVGGIATLTSPATSAPFNPVASAAAADGRIVVAGYVGTYGGPQYGAALALYRSDGQLEASFGVGGFASLPETSAPQTLAFDTAGRVLYAGAVAGPGLTVRRLTINGRSDANFGAGGVGTVSLSPDPARLDRVTAVATQPDGRIVLVGGDGVGRLTAGGLPDPTFGTNGGLLVSFPVNSFDAFAANTVAVLPDGRIVVAGQAKARTTFDQHYVVNLPVFDAAVVRLTSSGQYDTSFGAGGRAQITSLSGAVGAADSVQPLADGRLLVVGKESGYATGILTQSGSFAGLLTVDGKVDPAFGSGGQVARGGRAVALAGGRAAFVVNLDANGLGLQRLASDGTIDPTFSTLALPNVSQAYAGQPAAVSDGGVVFYGTTLVQGVSTPALVRVVGTTPVLPTPAGTVSVGGPANGQLTPLQPLNGGPFLPVSPLSVYPNFPGSVRTATADVNGDGVADYVTGAGPGGGPNVVVTDGKTGAVLANFNAFEVSFTGGVFVAAADITGDGKAEVVVTPDQGGGPVVAAYDGAGLTAGKNGAAQLTRFFGIDDSGFRGGARPALGDLNGDGRPDLVVAAGVGGGPRVAVYDGLTVILPSSYVVYAPQQSPSGRVNVRATATPPKLMGDFFVFEPTLRNGVFVAAGDLNGDGRAEIAFGGGPGGGPRVMALDGAALMAGRQTTVANFFAGDPASRGGVRVAMQPAADGSMRLLTGSGEGQPGSVGVYTAATALAGGPADQTLSPFGAAALADGVFVG